MIVTPVAGCELVFEKTSVTGYVSNTAVFVGSASATLPVTVTSTESVVVDKGAGAPSLYCNVDATV